MATKSSQIAVNGTKLTVTSNLVDGSYTVTDTTNRVVGTGKATNGGKFVVTGGNPAQVQAVLRRGTQATLIRAVENENLAILNKNAQPVSKTQMKSAGYGNKMNIPGDTTAVQPSQDATPAPPTGDSTRQSATAATGQQQNGTASDQQGGEAFDNLVGLARDTQETPSDFGSYRYPSEYINNLHDHVLFTVVEYIPQAEAGISAIISEAGAGRPTDRIKRQSSAGSIILPMPRNIVDQNSVTWGPDQLNALQAAGNTLVQGILNGGGAVNQAVDNVRGAVGSNSNELKSLITSSAAQSIIGGGNILTRTTGAVLNSNLELLFSGPNLRTFNFTYKMTPRESKEAIQCRGIIRTFKKAMAARLRGGALFLHTPHVFFIDFKHKGQDHPYLNRIKPCALLNFNVNYTPDGAYMTYEDGSPIAYELQFSFQELEPIYDKDYDTEEGKKGMGF